MQRVLLIDDERIERMILETILAEAGFNVYGSSISTTPFPADSNRFFDIAVLDLSVSAQHVPEILELCDTLAGTAILAMTDNATIEHALRLNATTIAVDYIKKPFSKEEFLAAVSRTLHHAQVLRENRALKGQETIRTPRQS
jgi:DNA-binding NtrC family response regulator